MNHSFIMRFVVPPLGGHPAPFDPSLSTTLSASPPKGGTTNVSTPSYLNERGAHSTLKLEIIPRTRTDGRGLDGSGVVAPRNVIVGGVPAGGVTHNQVA